MAGITFGSNVTSLAAQRRLARASDTLTLSQGRLSSGLRINRASDDAAGLAIADQLRVNTRLTAAAKRNVGDGVSLLQVVDGTLEQQSSILTRLLELAHQSSNGTLSSAQRTALNAEYQSLTKEFGRLGDTTRFNSLNLLQSLKSGGLSSLELQAGITGGTTSQLQISGIDSSSFSGNIDLNTTTDTPITQGTFANLINTFGASNLAYMSVIDESGRERTIIAAIYSEDFGSYATVSTLFFQRVSDTGGVGSTTAASQTVASTANEWILGAYGPQFDYTYATGEVTEAPSGSAAFLFDSTVVKGNLRYDLTSLTYSGASSPGVSTAINFTGVENATRAQSAISVVKNRLTSLSAQRGDVGALQSRLETSSSLLSTSQENLAAAESRIRDVDVAEESSRLLGASIIQQSASAVLAQANQEPGLLLSLLTEND